MLSLDAICHPDPVAWFTNGDDERILRVPTLVERDLLLSNATKMDCALARL